MKNILCVFGSRSTEHDISVITGVLTANSLDREVFLPVPIYITKDGEWYTGKALLDVEWYKTKDFKLLEKVALLFGNNILYTYKKGKLKQFCRIYCAINCCHGYCGEDGCLAGIMKMCKVPFASPRILGSAIAFDKCISKEAFKQLGFDYVPYYTLKRAIYYQNKEMATMFATRKLGFPVIVKPAHLGSSIAITVCEDKEKLSDALMTAFMYDDKVIVEKALENFTEANVAVYKYKGSLMVSRVDVPSFSGKIFTFEDKYGANAKSTRSSVKQTLNEKTEEKIKEIAGKIYNRFDYTGIIRIDFMIADGKIYVNEINSVPGSLAYYLFCDEIGEFKKLLTSLIEEGVNTNLQYESQKFTFDSSILNLKSKKH